MPDNAELHVGVLIDTSQIQSGMNATAEAAESTGARINTAFTEASAAPEKLAYSMMGARQAAMGLGEEIGVRLPRFVSTFLARSQTIGPVLASAFSAVAVVGLVQVLTQVPDAIEKIIGALAGWDEEARKDYEQMVKDNDQVILKNVEAAASIQRLGEIGKEGTDKYGLALKDNTAILKIYGTESANQLRTVGELQTKYDAMKGTLASLDAFSRADFGFGARREEIKSSLDSAKELLKTLTDTQVQMEKVKTPTEKAEFSEAARRQAEALQESAIAGRKSIGDAMAAADEASARAMRTLQQATVDQETDLLEGAEARKFQIDQKATQDRIALLKTEGVQHLAEVSTLQRELVTMEISHNAKIQELEDQRAIQNKKALDDESRAISDWAAKNEQEEIKARERIQGAAMEQSERGTTSGIAAQDRTGEGRIAEIKEQAEGLLITKRQELAQIKSVYEQEEAAATKSINAQIAKEKELQATLTAKGATPENSEALESSIRRQVGLQDELTRATAKYGEEIQKVSALQKASAVDGQQEYTMLANSINSGMSSAVAGWLHGTETFGEGMRKMLGGLLTQQAQFWTQWILKQAEAFVASKILGTADAAAKQAQATTTNEAMVQGSAGAGAAAAFASVIEALPFPFNVAVAPGIAASTLAQIEAFGAIAAFEGGGLVPSTGLALLHGGEMVLPAPISQKVQDATAGGSFGGGGDIHVHVHATDAGSFRNSDTMKQIKKELSRHARSIGLARK
jgi:hypothetical protein